MFFPEALPYRFFTFCEESCGAGATLSFSRFAVLTLACQGFATFER